MAYSRRLVYTVGYGGRRLSELVEILELNHVEVVVDVRRWNKSKLLDFSGNNLERVLGERGISYLWVPVLGGYRKFGVDTDDLGIAKCFKSEGFRAYATYITTRKDVKPHLDKLVEIALQKTTAILCKEKYPWLCHRKILSDYLVAKGFTVLHILEKNKVVEHELSSCAAVKNGELFYT